MVSSLPPLTQTTAEGKTLVRWPEVEAEILTLLERPPETWAKAATSGEAIVHLARRLVAEKGPRRVLGELVLALDERVLRIVKRFAGGFDVTTTEEIAIEIGKAVAEAVLDPSSRRADFLEATFLTAVKGRVLNEVRRRRRRPRPFEVAIALNRRERRTPGEAGQHTPDEGEELEGDLRDGVDEQTPEARYLDAEAKEGLRAALGAVKKPDHREAVILHYLKGWPIVDQDPDIETLCTRFGAGERQIRRWIRDAFADMRRALGEKS